MSARPIDQLVLKEGKIIFKSAFGEEYDLPNITTLFNLYQTTSNSDIKTRLNEILNHDLGSLLVVEIMIDATHEVTLKRLETGEISKNMKHVHDYYVIPKSHYALAKFQFESLDANASSHFEDCHFAMFPYGLVIKCGSFTDYKNAYTDCSELHKLLK